MMACGRGFDSPRLHQDTVLIVPGKTGAPREINSLGASFFEVHTAPPFESGSMAVGFRGQSRRRQPVRSFRLMLGPVLIQLLQRLLPLRRIDADEMVLLALLEEGRTPVRGTHSSAREPRIHPGTSTEASRASAWRQAHPEQRQRRSMVGLVRSLHRQACTRALRCSL